MAIYQNTQNDQVTVINDHQHDEYDNDDDDDDDDDDEDGRLY
jgi:hypothetical protein